MASSLLERVHPAIDFALFEGSPHAILVVDPVDYVVLDANPAAVRLYGYGRDELLRLRLSALWPRAETAIDAVGRTPPVLKTWRHRRKDGEWLQVMVAAQDIRVHGRAALALHVNDVTERAFSVALIESQGRVLEMVARGSPLERILAELVRTTESLSGGMLGSVMLLEGGRLRHRAAPSLPAAYRAAIDGVQVGPAVGSCGTAAYLGRPVIVTDIANDPLWKDYRHLALAHGLRACWSTPIFCRAGHVLGVFAMYYREVRNPGERDMRLVHATVDLAAIAIERDLADRELQDSESRLRAILDHASSVVYLKDLQGRYIVVNPHFERVTGMPASAVLGRKDADIFPAAVAEALAANDRKVLEARAPIEFQEELTLGGCERVYLSIKFPLLRAEGTPYAICGISSDITAMKRRKAELESSREELRALSARLQTVREEERMRISREIHDELGQVLTALRMNHTLVIRSVRSGEAASDRAGLLAQLESMQEQVKGALASVRRIATELRPGVLDSLGLAAALEWQAAEFSQRTGIACTVALPASVDADAERATALFRICQEALTNVVRHAAASRVQVELREDDGRLELSVADDGRGMALDGKPGIGVSLGMLGMRERAAALGGEVRFTSAPGRGTTVTVRLPAG
jgi:PAS domain S-box-containing protein